MSCTTVGVEKDGYEVPVITIELNPLSKVNKGKILNSIQKRLSKFYPNYNEFYFRLVNPEKSFILTGSGKRNVVFLKNRGLINTFTIKDNKIIKTTNEAYNNQVVKKLK